MRGLSAPVGALLSGVRAGPSPPQGRDWRQASVCPYSPPVCLPPQGLGQDSLLSRLTLRPQSRTQEQTGDVTLLVGAQPGLKLHGCVAHIGWERGRGERRNPSMGPLLPQVVGGSMPVHGLPKPLRQSCCLSAFLPPHQAPRPGSWQLETPAPLPAPPLTALQ